MGGYRDWTASDHGGRRTRVHDRANKSSCGVCGKSLDAFHDAKKCVNKFLAEQDALGNPSNTRRKPS